MKRTSSNPSALSESLQRHLNAYALAASAAGVGALALVQPAEAKIIYTKTYHVIHGPVGTLQLDLNHDGINDFLFAELASRSSGFGKTGGYLHIIPYSGNSVVTTDGGDAAALHAGVRVGGNGAAPPKYIGPTMASYTARGCSHQCSSNFFGPWADGGKGVRNRYLGFKFVVKGKTHYGWARLNVRPDSIVAALTGYAYETIPNKPIIAGKTKGRDLITIQPGSLGRLAQGSAAK